MLFAETSVPPLDRIADPTWQWVVLTIAGAAYAVAVVAGLREWRRTGKPVLVLALIGGAIATLMEPMYDLMSRLYMFEKGAHLLFTVGGRGMQLWAPVGYGVYIGITVYVFYLLALSPKTTRKTYWLAVGAIMGMNLLIEIPATRLGLYEYYGPQAFNLTGFPLYWLLSNITGAAAAGVLFAKAPQLINGVRVLTIVILVPSCFIAGEVFVQWPAFAAVSSEGSGYPVVYAGALVTIAIGVFALRTMARLVAPNSGDLSAPSVTRQRQDGAATPSATTAIR